MVDVNESLTRKVAELARLELSEPEARTFTAQLRGILDYVGQLAEADVTGIEPMVQPFESETPLRQDVARGWPLDSEGRPAVLASAPEVVDQGFKVPPIL